MTSFPDWKFATTGTKGPPFLFVTQSLLAVCETSQLSPWVVVELGKCKYQRNSLLFCYIHQPVLCFWGLPIDGASASQLYEHAQSEFSATESGRNCRNLLFHQKQLSMVLPCMACSKIWIVANIMPCSHIWNSDIPSKVRISDVDPGYRIDMSRIRRPLTSLSVSQFKSKLPICCADMHANQQSYTHTSWYNLSELRTLIPSTRTKVKADSMEDFCSGLQLLWFV